MAMAWGPWHVRAGPGATAAGPPAAGAPRAGKAGELNKGPAQARDKEMKLTRIDFKGWMFSNTKANYKNATFRDSVEVFHIPSEIFEVAIDPDKLPKDGFYIK